MIFYETRTTRLTSIDFVCFQPKIHFDCILFFTYFLIVFIGIPLPTAYGIIERFMKYGRRAPLARGSKAVVYDSKKIMKFVSCLLSDTTASNFSLSEIRREIAKRSTLLSPGLKAPSIDWIGRHLRCELHWTRKVATIEPHRRNCDKILLERREFVLWLESLSKDDARR